ncbi:DUF4231 domain-containing protein [Nocardioides sp. GXQ0305]|uniref:DUF4231 domain-containing protein n=1 Tax=Nocardioides sp. GXQ0305 TaxID=3423912 RepID=UPI003D7E8DB8
MIDQQRNGNVDGLKVPAKYSQLFDRLLAAHPGADQGAYVEGRWLCALVGARTRMRRDELVFGSVNLVTLSAAAVSPVLVAATAATTGTTNTRLTIAAVVCTLIAAIGAVLVQTLRPGIRWRLHRKLRDQLEAIGWAHLMELTSTPHATASDAAPQTSDSTTSSETVTDPWASFVANVERAILLHNTAAAEVAGVLGAKPGVELATTANEE